MQTLPIFQVIKVRVQFCKVLAIVSKHKYEYIRSGSGKRREAVNEQTYPLDVGPEIVHHRFLQLREFGRDLCIAGRENETAID